MKIGVFDSGIGGITVLDELVRRFPREQYVYLGDTARVPYGTKSTAQVQSFTVECAQTLATQQIDVLVVACNTASSSSLPGIRQALPSLPVFGVVEPGVDACWAAWNQKRVTATTKPPILILGTRGTIRSGIYGRLLRERFTANKTDLPEILEQACPLLVPMIEENWMAHRILRETVQEYLKPYRGLEPGIAHLACTHYPWIQSVFESELPGWTVINSACTVADSLAAQQPLSSQPLSTGERSQVEWIFTDPDAIPEFAKAAFGSP